MRRLLRQTPILLLLAALATVIARPAAAAELQADRTCLSAAAAQEAIYAGQARRLSELRDGLDGELIRADLCRNGGGYVYIVTTLGKNGKVKRQVIDAAPTAGAVAPVRNGY